MSSPQDMAVSHWLTRVESAQQDVRAQLDRLGKQGRAGRLLAFLRLRKKTRKRDLEAASSLLQGLEPVVGLAESLPDRAPEELQVHARKLAAHAGLTFRVALSSFDAAGAASGDAEATDATRRALQAAGQAAQSTGRVMTLALGRLDAERQAFDDSPIPGFYASSS